MQKILFNDKYGLTDTVLSGQKTQTRRIVPKSAIVKYSIMEDPTVIGCTRYKVGGVVAVAQRYCDVAQGGFPVDSRYDAFREYNWGEGKEGALEGSKGWTNKMFVKADLMPHQIQITDVRVERLQDISDEDCIDEGIIERRRAPENLNCYLYPNMIIKNGIEYFSPREAYAALIDKISGKGTWESNPYVFVYDFKLVR